MYHKCKTNRCRTKVNDTRLVKDSGYCTKCISRIRRDKDPVKSTYIGLRNSAKRRGKEFTISLEYFRIFAQEHSLFLGNKGKYGRNFYRTIDRKNQDLGYVEGNLQVLTRSENSRKRFVDYWRKKYAELEEEAKYLLEKREGKLEKDIKVRRTKEEKKYIKDFLTPIPEDKIPF